MVISGVIATVTLVATLVLLFVGGLALEAEHKRFDAHREH